MATVILKSKRKPRIETGHPWVFDNEVEAIDGAYTGGDIVDVVNISRHFIGRGYINDCSKIIVRLLTYHDEPIDQAFFNRRIENAVAYRNRVIKDTDAYRVVNAEGDFLPGLIVDRYRDYLVVQILSLGMERYKETVINSLKKIINPAGIYERNDVGIRQLEGLKEYKGFLTAPFETGISTTLHGVTVTVDIAQGQKTGLFLDQRENYLELSALSEGKKVLNCFSYSGGFGLFAVYYGAKNVLNIDSSKEAIRLGSENARLNGFEDRAVFKEANAFDELKYLSKEGERFDMVILDPPAFVKDKKSLNKALSGYKEINLRAMRLLDERGILVTCSCSQHITRELFKEILNAAAYDTKKKIRLLRDLGPGKDHPLLLAAKETDYLKCLILEVN